MTMTTTMEKHKGKNNALVEDGFEPTGTTRPPDASGAAHPQPLQQQAEGYSPLQDMQLMMGGGGGGEMLLFSDGTTTVFAAEGGSVFSSLGRYDGDDDEGESSSDEKDVDSIVPNFRNVADNALSLLEDDYLRTVQRTLIEPEEQHIFEDRTIVDEGGMSKIEGLASSELESSKSGSNPNVRSYFADFSDFESHQPTVNSTQTLPEIDVAAVQKAIFAIGKRDTKLRTAFQEWDHRQKAEAVTPPRLHSIIPTAPLAAFRRQTAKAQQATANLSRSATIAEALRCLNLLKRENGDSETILRLHVVGCDHVECESEQRLRTLFGPIVRWIGAYAEAPTHLELDLIGPNVPACAATAAGPLNIMPTLNHDTGSHRRATMKSAVLRCHRAVYEDWLTGASCSSDEFNSDLPALPDLAIAFNAGVWGYREWKNTIRYLMQQRQSVPFVFTAYTLQEAEDDYEVIQELTKECGSRDLPVSCSWEPIGNPFASRQDRETATAMEGRRYRENAAWQGWRF